VVPVKKGDPQMTLVDAAPVGSPKRASSCIFHLLPSHCSTSHTSKLTACNINLIIQGEDDDAQRQKSNVLARIAFAGRPRLSPVLLSNFTPQPLTNNHALPSHPHGSAKASRDPIEELFLTLNRLGYGARRHPTSKPLKIYGSESLAVQQKASESQSPLICFWETTKRMHVWIRIGVHYPRQSAGMPLERADRRTRLR
jgi:hypothetical protein